MIDLALVVNGSRFKVWWTNGLYLFRFLRNDLGLCGAKE